MARKFHKIEAYHGGVNTKSDARDILDTQLSEAKGISVDDIGRITNAGSFTTITNSASTKPAATHTGYGLFRFSSDYHKDWDGDPDTGTRTDYILAFRHDDNKLYWSPNGGDWETPTHLNTSVDFLDLSNDESPKLRYYSVDGAIRGSDTSFATANDPVWIGAIDRTLFPSPGTETAKTGWYKEDQSLTAPSNGNLSLSPPDDADDLSDNRVFWHIRNMRDDTTLMGTSSELMASSSTWTLTDPYDSGDEHWQTESRQILGFDGDTYYRRLGWRLSNENDDTVAKAQKWTSPSFTNSTAISSGKSLYLAVRVENQNNKDMWLGTETVVITDNAAAQTKFSDAQIRIETSSGVFISWEIDTTPLIEAPVGEWVVLELPYDAVDKKTDSAHTNLTPTKFIFQADLSIKYTGSAAMTTTGFTDDALPVLHVSDLRIGDSDKVGTSGAQGVKKFAYSYIYDENQDAESLLYSFSSPITLHPNEWGYKIGINAYIKSITNNRVTGANLYMVDEDIPYRVAELDFMKGLKGAWESEFPADKLGSSINSFTTFDTTCNKSNIIETTGLPLLESFEALNGFKPTVDTITASYKTAVVLNRKVYIGNVKQNGKAHGDRMIKSVTNSFDCFPSRGREIDVAINDGDEIIHLDTYADRILQFKKNSMYLINATKSAEFLEDTFIGMGVTNPGAVCKTDFGIAWVNENGCYLYDGQKVNNLTEPTIRSTDWSDHIVSDSQIFYYPNKRKIFVTGSWVASGGAQNRDLYEYCLTTQGWTRHQGKIGTSVCSNFILDDNVVKFLDASGNLKQWDDSEAADPNILVKTSDIDFGNPGTLKRIYKIFVTWKSTNDAGNAAADSFMTVTYGTDGEATQTKVLKFDRTSSMSGTLVNDSKNITVASTSNIHTGMSVTGSSIPSGATVESVTNSTVFVLSTSESDWAGAETLTITGDTTNGYLAIPSGTDWETTELRPNAISEAKSIRSIQLKFQSNGTTPKNFQINDITIVYRERMV